MKDGVIVSSTHMLHTTEAAYALLKKQEERVLIVEGSHAGYAVGDVITVSGLRDGEDIVATIVSVRGKEVFLSDPPPLVYPKKKTAPWGKRNRFQKGR